MGSVGPIVGAGVGFLALGVAIWGVITQRAIARRRATLDLIARAEADSDLIAARRKFIELAKSPNGLGPWAAQDKEGSEEVEKIKITLNEFEMIAIGIQRGIIEYELYRRWYRSGVIRYWNHAAPFITQLRARLDNPALYHEFEEMMKWFLDEKMPRRRIGWGQWF